MLQAHKDAYQSANSCVNAAHFVKIQGILVHSTLSHRVATFSCYSTACHAPSLGDHLNHQSADFKCMPSTCTVS